MQSISKDNSVSHSAARAIRGAFLIGAFVLAAFPAVSRAELVAPHAVKPQVVTPHAVEPSSAPAPAAGPAPTPAPTSSGAPAPSPASTAPVGPAPSTDSTVDGGEAPRSAAAEPGDPRTDRAAAPDAPIATPDPGALISDLLLATPWAAESPAEPSPGEGAAAVTDGAVDAPVIYLPASAPSGNAVLWVHPEILGAGFDAMVLPTALATGAVEGGVGLGPPYTSALSFSAGIVRGTGSGLPDPHGDPGTAADFVALGAANGMAAVLPDDYVPASEWVPVVFGDAAAGFTAGWDQGAHVVAGALAEGARDGAAAGAPKPISLNVPTDAGGDGSLDPGPFDLLGGGMVCATPIAGYLGDQGGTTSSQIGSCQ